VLVQQLGELRHERDIPNCRGGLGRHPPRRDCPVGAREVGAHADHAGGEVDVVPDQPQQLRDAQPRVERGGEQGPAPRYLPLSGREPAVGAIRYGEQAGVQIERNRP
jgi:hypothetical protein